MQCYLLEVVTMLEFLILTCLAGGIFDGIRSCFLPSNHPSNVKMRKERWLADHPNERWKCPYK